MVTEDELEEIKREVRRLDKKAKGEKCAKCGEKYDKFDKLKKFAETSVYYRKEDFNRCLNRWKKVHHSILGLI